MACAFDPPYPNEFTLARRSIPWGHGVAVLQAMILDAWKSILGFGISKVGFPGMMPRSTANTVLSMPEIPAAGSEWPMLLLTDPMRSLARPTRDGEKTEEAALHSIGSPASVPVPWHSKYAVSPKLEIPARA